jgi:hypothetical protein
MNENLKEVFEKLIPIYEDAIVNCPDEFRLYLDEKGLDTGICWASKHLLGIDVSDEMRKIEIGYWHRSPIQCRTKAEAIECLQWRVDRMKELISKMETTN